MIAPVPNRNDLKQAYWKGYDDNGRISMLSFVVGLVLGLGLHAVILWIIWVF